MTEDALAPRWNGRAMEATLRLSHPEMRSLRHGGAGLRGLARDELEEVRIAEPWIVLESRSTRALPLLGAPLVHDLRHLALDSLTPWPVIARRIEAAADADFVIGLYNPASGRRTRQIVEAHDIILRHRPGSTPVGLVKRAGIDGTRRDQRPRSISWIMIGMLTTVLVGSSNTFCSKGMVTPRGYTNKYMDATWTASR